ncbi:Plasmodium exported protein, unknown function [Plasmodium ovale wallikeri]|uniref:Pv-fam-d protein n=2 Tax=Plasmodium ovale TaxID=36330 RepID=A0A1A9AMS0_PLAOA|nr:Plasmodium exported protein, unknown function [Plasmodium ovale wallikeri]SBT57485.1 Plasmodium exported protein, unknown function [Plasmodium ovale wallikeri]SBT72647.1 Plasmodium exported protein, unknown function [Plasmodium ovale]
MIALSAKIFTFSLLIWSSQYSYNSNTSRASCDKKKFARTSFSTRCNRLLLTKTEVEHHNKYAELRERIRNLIDEDDEKFEEKLYELVHDDKFRNHFIPFVHSYNYQRQFKETEQNDNIPKKYNPAGHHYGEEKYISSYNFDDHNEDVSNELDNNDDIEGYDASKRNYTNEELRDMEIYDQGITTMRNHKKKFHKDLNFRNKHKKFTSELRRFLRKIDISIESKLVKLIQKHLKITDKTHSTKSRRKFHTVLRFLYKRRPSPLFMLVISILIGITYGVFGSFVYSQAVSTLTILSAGNPFIGLASLYSIIFMSVIVAYIITGGAFIVQYMFFKILKIYLTYSE